MNSNRQHILQSPLIVYSGGPVGLPGLLPKGTCLRYMESFDEGFDRYQIYVNVERFPLPLEDAQYPDLVDPLSAFQPSEAAIDLEELRKILQTLGVRREDIQLLLHSYR